MAAVAIDADVLIGFLDPRDAQHERAVTVLGPWLASGHTLLIPASVYAEILVQPIRQGVAETVDEFLADARIQVVPVDRMVARRAAQLRATHESLRLPDAFALGTALEHHAEFLTLDVRLQRVAEHQERGL